MLKYSILIAVALLPGCSKITSDADAIQASSPAVSPSPAVPRPASMDEWKAALLSTYQESSSEDKGDGITEFVACFYKGEEKCGELSFARRDTFRKLRFFVPGLRSSMSGATYAPYVKTYVSLPDGQLPALFITPTFSGKDSWLFMNKVAIMVDGDVVLERDIPHSDVKRESESWGVEEVYGFIATDDDIAALRKVNEQSKVLIRITGDKGYVSVDDDSIKMFKQEVTTVLYVYDTISKGVEGHLPPSTSEPAS